MNNKNNTPPLGIHLVQLGRYRISPMSQARDDGGFDALVSIRSGQGRASVDRVMRFTPRFGCQQSALRYAKAEGLTWARSHWPHGGTQAASPRSLA